MTVSVFASGVRGTTSPRPSVKNVVPLMYMSAPNPGSAPVMLSAEPAAHCTIPNKRAIPTTPTTHRMTGNLADLGELGFVIVAVAEHSPRRQHVHSTDQVDHSVAAHHRGSGREAAPRLRVREHRRLRSLPSIS